MANSTDSQIEALLFALGRPLSRTELQKMLGVSQDAIESGLKTLAERKAGVSLVDDGIEVELRIDAQNSALIEKIRKEE